MLHLAYIVWSTLCLSAVAEWLSCPYGWKDYGYTNRCFKMSVEPLDWSDALENCYRISGSLAQFQDAFYIDSMIKLNTKSPGEHGSSDVWIGASRVSDGVDYKWLDGRTVGKGQFTRTGGQYASAASRDMIFWVLCKQYPPHCLALSTDHENGVVGLPCKKKLRSVCEREVISTASRGSSAHNSANERMAIYVLIHVTVMAVMGIMLCSK